ncbi:unnamed protein product [Symbiodinium natans]|uniref:Phosphatidic acid phosphatase type 2/haloperoxidase domain-containing protein n=1 Tax=Symbiodinium natans TaxID=878477 RepID=A0A812QD36_9DINO|nr:unnamed protein product [Symbiodinium natans]
MVAEPRALQNLSTVVVGLVATSIPAGLSLAAGFLWTARVEWAWTILGAVLLDLGVLHLKALLQHPRPVSHPAYVLPSEGPFGMPSEHAAFAAFLVGQLHARQTRLAAAGFRRSVRAACLGLLVLWALGVILMRYITGAHSIVQLLAGAGCGLCASIVWWKLEAGPLADAMVLGQCFTDSARRCVIALYGC